MRADAERLTRETLDETREQGRAEGEEKTKMETLKRVLADEATAALSWVLLYADVVPIPTLPVEVMRIRSAVLPPIALVDNPRLAP